MALQLLLGIIVEYRFTSYSLPHQNSGCVGLQCKSQFWCCMLRAAQQRHMMGEWTLAAKLH
jgi:hypothetical protein